MGNAEVHEYFEAIMIKISVVTVCWNAAETIEKCLNSVKQQKYPNIEHIIIDGSSTDQTLNIISNQNSPLITLVSEPDNGIYDAMNKGLKLAKGEIIHFLNADDYYVDEDVIADVAHAFNDGNQIILGNVRYGGTQHTWLCTEPTKYKIKFGWHPPHPGFFCSRKTYETVGKFNTSYQISADFDLMMRIVLFNNLDVHVLNRTTTEMSPHGRSASLKGILIGNLNVARSAIKNKISFIPVLYLICRLIPKLKRKLNIKT
jgi:glycosyltransferase involved in cell wall biosynthesis